MFFFRQTLLSVCLILLCALAVAQPTATDDTLPSINEDAGSTTAYNILLNDVPGASPINPLTIDLFPTTSIIDNPYNNGNGTFSADPAGLVTFTPNVDYEGTTSIGYTVDDDDDLTSNEATISVLVNAVNDAPTIAPLANQVINEDASTGALTLTITDPDDALAGLTLTGSSDNDAIIPDANVVFSFAAGSWRVTATPLANQNGGPVTITVNVSDGVNPAATMNFDVTVTAVNDAPTIAPLANQVINEDASTGALALTITDPDDALAGLTLTGSSDSDAIIPDANVVFSFTAGSWRVAATPLANQNGGPVTITVSVSDGVNPAATMNFDVNVNAVNDAPTIAPLANQVVNEDTSTGALALTITDPDNALAGLTLTGSSDTDAIIPDANVVFSFAAGSWRVTATPLANQNGGPVTITVNVSDGVNPAATMNFDVTVTAVNDAPTIAPLANQVINEDASTGALALTITDPDNALAGLTLTGSSDMDAIIPDANVVYSFAAGSWRVTATPLANQNGGPVTITVNVSDGVNPAATMNFDVTVTAVNDAPTIAPLANQVINEGTSTGALNLTIADPDNALAGLTLTGSSDTDAIIPDANVVFSFAAGSWRVTATPLANQNGGPVTITVNVSDGVNPAATMNFNVTVTTVNDAPTIAPLANQVINEDASTGALALTITDPDNALAGLTLTGSSDNDAIIPDANVVFSFTAGSWRVAATPLANQNGGPVTITVNVSDGVNPPATMNFNVTVTPVNDAPTVAPLANQVISEGTSTGALNLTITDPDNALASLTLTGSSDTDAIIPDANVIFSFAAGSWRVTATPLANQNGGPVTITVNVSDGVNPAATMNFDVTVTAVNDAPTIAPLANQVINEDASTGALALTITDPDNALAGLTLTGSSDNDAIIPDANVVFSFTAGSWRVAATPLANQNGGPVTITVSVSDGVNPAATMNFNVTVTPVNDAPTVAPLADQVISEGTSTGALNLTITDPDDALASLTLTGSSDTDALIPDANVAFSFAAGSWRVTATPLANQNGGPVTITVNVSDGVNPAATMNFDVTVTAVNDAPTVAPLANQVINEDASTGALALTITDPDNALAGLTLTGSSDNDAIIPDANVVFSFTAGSWRVAATPLANQNGGPVTITVNVSDGVNPAATMTFNVTVTAVNDAPTIAAVANQVINEDGSTGALALIITDPDDALGTLTLTGSSDNDAIIPDGNVLLNFSAGSWTVAASPLANQNGGPVIITVNVSDGVNAAATINFNVTVTPVNDAPTIAPLANQVINEDGSTGALNLAVADLDNAIGTLTLTGSSDNDAIIPDANVVFNFSAGSWSVTVTPLANQSGGPVTITVNVSDAVNPAATTNFNVTITGTDDAPTITAIANQTTNEDVPTSPLTFTVADAETPVGDLIVTATSDTQGVIPDGNIVIANAGANKTVQVTPAANQSGTAIIQIVVSDGVNSASTTFQITVNTVNDTPTISTIADQTISEDTQTSALSFTVDDVETSAGSLVVTKSSNNQTLVPDANIVIAGTGATRTVQVTPVTNLFGTAVITVSVSDGPNTAVENFQITVTAVNDLPTITSLTDQTINEDNATAALSFSVSDLETPVASLTVTGTSDNVTLVPNASIVVSGTGATRTVTITPAANQFGIAIITLRVNDGTNDTPTSFQITVSPSNDAPVITGQTPVSTNEEQPILIELSQLTIADVDNVSGDFTLSVLSNPNYSFSVNTITPNANVTGNITVRVQVNDGAANSNIYNLQVSVSPVNDPPVITGQPSALSVMEDNSITIVLSNMTISDPDNATGFSFTLASGSNYSVSGSIVTPDPNYNGTLSVPATVSDGTSSSAPFNLQIQVNPVNDKPQISGQIPVSIAEVQPVTIEVSQLTIFDPDNTFPGDFTLYVLGGTNYTASGNTITPTANFSGSLQVRVFVSDTGPLNSDIYNFQIQVNSTNDAPVITGHGPLSTPEGQPLAINFADLSVSDPDNAYPIGFTLTILPGSNYTFSANTITPNANINGLIDVIVKVNDGLVDSQPYVIKVSVNGVNDPPVITGQFPLSILEDGGIELRLADLQISDPDSPLSGFTMTVSPGTNYTLSNNNVEAADNFFGTLSVPVVVNDGSANSNPYNVQITVTPVNDPPSIKAHSPLTTFEDQPITLALQDFTVTDVDNTFPTGFTLIIPGNAANFTVSGTTVIPASNFSGVLGVNLVVNDGATPSANSDIFTAQITVNSVNDAPTLDAINNVTIQEDPLEPITLSLTNITAGIGEGTQVVGVTASTNKPEFFDVFEVVYGGGSTASIRVKPKANIFGTATITVRVQDDGLASPAPNVNFFERTFDFVIDPVNDIPSFTSEPKTLAELGQPYEYTIRATDVEGEVITITALTLPSWLTLTQTGNGEATLSGTPPAGTTGNIPIVVQANDPAAASVTDQQFLILVNSRPVIKAFQIETDEDNTYTFNLEFANNFTDADGNVIAELQIAQLPTKGTLKLNGNDISLNAKISTPFNTTDNILIYVPLPDSTGTDLIRWNASDGVYYSASDTDLTVKIRPLNDLPEIIAIEPPESDTLKYELGSERPIQLTNLFDARDADGDDIVAAEIGFFGLGDYRPEQDQFLFRDTLDIKHDFDEETGILTLFGKRSVKDYVAAIRTVKYNYIDATGTEIDDAQNRRISFRLKDEASTQTFGQTKERLVRFIYTYLEIDIANAFTPDGDNPYWNIYSPNGLGQYKDALVRVYNKRGTLVYEATGFSNKWNGSGPDGSVLPPDSYYYTIDLKYDKKKYKGVVTILR